MKESNILFYLHLRSLGLLKKFRNKRVVLCRPPKDIDWWIWKSNKLI